MRHLEGHDVHELGDQREFRGVTRLWVSCTRYAQVRAAGIGGIDLSRETRLRDPYIDLYIFDPKRFNENRKQSIENMTFFAFGERPRICAGIAIKRLLGYSAEQLQTGIVT